jgi:hypothetical protein
MVVVSSIEAENVTIPQGNYGIEGKAHRYGLIRGKHLCH